MMLFRTTLLCGLLGLTWAHGKGNDFVTTSQSVKPGGQVEWVGEATTLSGENRLEVGKPLPEIKLTDLKMKSVSLAELTKGKAAIISVVPSLDTPVCEVQTHELAEHARVDGVLRITISRDLPYAMKRFQEETKFDSLIFLSDYRFQEFGNKLGLSVERNGLLARSLIVLDPQGKVKHFQITPKIVEKPDMKAAFLKIKPQG